MKNSTATLCSLAIGLWGYQTGIWKFAIPMMLILEARVFIKRRWTFREEYFQTVHVAAAFLWLLAIFNTPLNAPSPIPYDAGYHLLKCLPIGFFPLIVCQTYFADFISFYPTLFGTLKNSNSTLNLYYPYLGICLLAASATGGNIALFLGLAGIVVAGFLGTLRSQRFGPNTFLGLMFLAVLLSLIGTQQYYWLQANVKLPSPESVGELIQKIASSASKEINPGSKDIFKPEESKKVDPEMISSTAEGVTPPAKGVEPSQNNSSPSPSPGLPQNTGASPSVTPSPVSIANSQGTGLPQSTPQSTETAGLPQNAGTPSAPQNSSSTTSVAGPATESGGVPGGAIASSQTSTPQSSSSSNASTPTPAQGVSSTQGTGQTSSPSTSQGTSQQGGGTSGSNAPQVSSATSQSTGKNSPQIFQSAGGSADPKKSSTQIGNSGALVLSDAVVFKVSPHTGSGTSSLAPTFPLYLREATYNQYNSGDWNAAQSQNSPKASQSNRQRWTFGSKTSSTMSVRISTNLQQREEVLKLPVGTSEIDNLAVDSMQVNQYGSVAVQGKPGQIAYTAHFDPTRSLDSPPTSLDMDIPQAESAAVQKVLQSLNLQGKSGQAAINSISSFFSDNFQYSLNLPIPPKNTTGLSNFLLQNRAGHCEYFASATSLLLRSVGIPSRYAVGYYVHEYSPSEQAYIVRAQDAHAWVMAYINGDWKTLDTTPSSGLLQIGTAAKSLENNTAQGNTTKAPVPNVAKPSAVESPKKPQADNFFNKDNLLKEIKSLPSKLSEAWSSLNSYISKQSNPVIWAGVLIALGVVIILLSLFFVLKMLQKKRSQHRKWRRKMAKASSEPIADGLDSEFYLLEERLGEQGLNRQPSETVRQWIVRLKQKLPESQMSNLNQIIDLHYCYRFDPQGITPDDRAKLRSMIQSWLVETTV